MNVTTHSYLDWIKHLPINDDELATTTCLNCESTGLDYQYFGFEDSESGWKIVWCKSCNVGIQISRTVVPDNADALVDQIERDRFLEQHKQLELIS